MARGATKRSQQVRAAKTAAPRRKPSRGARRQSSSHSYEDALFFPKLRNHAKWVFVFLAFAFAIGFVIFGVGTGQGFGGLGDLINGSNNTAGGPSISDLQKKVQSNPSDAGSWRKLASAYEVKGQSGNAVNALVRYTTLKPKDANAFNELANLYATQATNLTPAITAAQSQVSSVTPNPYFQPTAISPSTKKTPGQPIFITPQIDSTLSTIYNSKLQQLQAKQKGVITKAETSFQNVSRLQPKNAQVELSLGQFAYNFGDIPTATLAFKRYLVLAPHSPQAALVRKQLKILSPSSQLTKVQPQGK